MVLRIDYEFITRKAGFPETPTDALGRDDPVRESVARLTLQRRPIADGQPTASAITAPQTVVTAAPEPMR